MSADEKPFWFDKAETSQTHTAAAVSVAEKKPQQQKQLQKGAADILNTLLWIIDSDGQGVAVNFSHIEEINTDSEKQRLRLFLPRSLIDITTNNIADLVAAIGRRKVARLEVGEISDTINITSITIYDSQNLPNPNQ